MNLLRTTLTINAITSAVAGLVLTGGPIPLSRWLGISGLVSAAVGLGLLIFAAYVTKVARSPRTTQVKLVIAADVVWVVVAFTIVIAFSEAMTTEGIWVLGVVSAAVAAFAVLQTMGLRRSLVHRSVEIMT